MRKPLLKVMFSLLLTSVGAMAQDGLLVHLKLNEAGGELAKDSSGNGHDGTLLGVASCKHPVGGWENPIMQSPSA